MTSETKGPVPVTFIQRKARSVGNYSVEFIFDDVRSRLNGKIIPTILSSRYESSGLFKRLYNCIEAGFSQGAVNHVTGDVNYLGLFLDKRKTIHTILDCVFLEKSTGIKFSILKYFWLKVPLRKSAFVTAISLATKNEILKYESCDPAKIKVIPVAISQGFTYQPKQFNKQKPVILQIGTAPNKNVPRLVAALESIPCQLIIVGKRDESIVRLLEEKKIDYLYRSGLSEAELKAAYQDADIISFVSTYEGFGMPILEGQATGRVVVTSFISSMPEVAGDAACLVDPYDIESISCGIRKVIENDQYRDELINKGLKNIGRFNPDVIADQYLQLYSEVVKRN